MTQLTELQEDTPKAAHPTLTALVVLTGVFLSSLDLFIVNIAFPSISLNFHGESLSSLSWVLSAYTIVFAALLVPAGRWADRVDYVTARTAEDIDAVLIRPDGYIAWSGADGQNLETALARWFG